MKAIKFYFSLVALSLVLSFAGTGAQAQCAMCRSSVESTQNDNKLTNFGKGLNKGILYLMAFPYILVGTVGFLYYRHQRKNK